LDWIGLDWSNNTISLIFAGQPSEQEHVRL